MRALLVSGAVAVGYGFNLNKRHLDWIAITTAFDKVGGALPVHAGSHGGPAVGRVLSVTRDDARLELHAALLIWDAAAIEKVKGGSLPAMSFGYNILRAEERSGGLLHVRELEATDIALSPAPSSPRCLVSEWREVELPAAATAQIHKSHIAKRGTKGADMIDSRIARDMLAPVARDLDRLASRMDRFVRRR